MLDSALERIGLSERARNALLGGLGMMGFPFLIGLGAYVAIPMKPYGVPMTLQPLMVLLAALALGPRLGFGSLIIYLFAGACGAKWFSEGEGGFAMLMGATGGYLFGFALAQPVIGWIARTRDSGGAIKMRGWWSPALAVFVGMLVVYAVGVPWLYVVLNQGDGAYSWGDAFNGGVKPFIAGDIVKIAIAGMLGIWLTPHSIRRGW